MLRIRPAALALATAVPLTVAAIFAAVPPAAAGDDGNDFLAWTCKDLWMRRNTLFQDGGYCFQSPRAIKQFGNAGCQYDDESAVPLSDYARDDIRQIKAAEKAKGC